MTQYDLSKPYIQYIEDVLSGKEIAGWFMQKACERAKSWFDKEEYILHYEEVDKKIKLVQKIKQKKGLQAGKPFILLPFQQFIFMNIFGWYYKGTDKRVISNVLICMARQTGKSYLSAAIALAIALDPTLPSPTVDYLATTSKQAAICFQHCKDQTSSIDPKGKIFHRYRNEIRVPLTGATLTVLSSDDNTLDGRASYYIMDELHAMKNWRLWEVMASGQGSLKNPLAIACTTCGWYIGEQYPLYSMYTQAKNIFNGTYEDASWFYAIFQLDDNDDWKDESVWKKAVPTLGIAVDEDYMRKRIQEAINNPTKEVEVRTKNLNQWVQSEKVWISNEKIQAVTRHFELADFDSEEDYCLMGMDLAYVDDLCVLTTLVNKDGILYFKAFPFIAHMAYENSPNKELYRQWVKNGHIILVDDDVVDFDWVVEKIKEINEVLPIALVAYDPFQSRQIQIKCTKEGIPVKGVNQGNASFHEPTTMLEQLIYKADNVVFDDNPVIAWCFGNVLIKLDEKANKKPIKSDDDNKIDIVIAFIQTIKMWMDLSGLSFDTEVTVLE